MPDITPAALVSTHDDYEEADEVATAHRLGPNGEALVYVVHDFEIVASYTEKQLLEGGL